MNVRRFIRLLRSDLYLLRRHGAVTSIGVFTGVLCILVTFFFHEGLKDLPSEFMVPGIDPLSAALSDAFPGIELSWRGLVAVIVGVRTLPFCLPLILAVFTGRVVANSIREHTMREDLVRPITRDWLLSIRFCALSLYSLYSLMICLVLGLILGMAIGLNGFEKQVAAGGWESPGLVALLLGLVLVWVADMAVISIAMLVSLLVQPTGRVLLVLVLGFVIEGILRGSLMMHASMTGTRGGWSENLASWLPGEALDSSWQQWPLENWDVAPVVATISILVGCLFLSGLRFRKMDIT